MEIACIEIPSNCKHKVRSYIQLYDFLTYIHVLWKQGIYYIHEFSRQRPIWKTLTLMTILAIFFLLLQFFLSFFPDWHCWSHGKCHFAYMPWTVAHFDHYNLVCCAKGCLENFMYSFHLYFNHMIFQEMIWHRNQHWRPWTLKTA